MKNKNLHEAKRNKNDEFYTQLVDIENELKHYKKHFKDKVVYCNCDDPKTSNFSKYFIDNFEKLGLKKLIVSCYKNQEMGLFNYVEPEQATYLEYGGSNLEIKYLKGDGDFRGSESIELLKQADIVVTNPPFSLFREYVAQLSEYDKKFIIVGSVNAINYKEIFKLIKENKMWLGYGFKSGKAFFKTPYPNDFAKGVYNQETGLVKFCNVTWFTNIKYKTISKDLDIYKQYTPEEYPKYDNYNAINVNRVAEIPMDYVGAMGVPITFMDKYNPEQFEIIDGLNRYSILTGPTKETKGKYLAQVNGKPVYARIIIKNKRLGKAHE